MEKWIFWFFMLATVMLIPVTMLLCGKWFLEKPPGTINRSLGYRTARSMKNQETWAFAQQKCGRIWEKTGAVMLPVSVAAFLPSIGAQISNVGSWAIIITVLQCAAMLFTFIPVERALKRSFDQYGRRINK